MLRRMFALALVTAAVSLAAEVPLIELIPAEANVIGGIHVDRTVNSPFGQYVLSQMNNTDKDFEEFISATGFDPRRDLRDIVFASTGVQKKGPGLVLARGVFNGPQLLNAIRTKQGGEISVYNGVSVLERSGGPALAFADGSLAMAGDSALVRAAIDRRNGGAAGTLAAKANSVSNLYDAWMVTNGVFRAPLPATGSRRSPMVSPNIEGIVETSGGLTFGSVIRFAGEAVTRSDKDAQALVDVVRFLSSMFQMQAGNNPEAQKLQPIFDSLDVKAQSNVVKMSFAIPQTDLEKLMQDARKPARAAAR